MKSSTIRTSFSSFFFLGAVALAATLGACADSDNMPAPLGGGETPDGGGTVDSGERPDGGRTLDDGGVLDDGGAIDGSVTPDGGPPRGRAYCTQLTVKADGAAIFAKGGRTSPVDHLSQGDLVIRTFTKDPFFEKYEVDYLTETGAIASGEISKNDVIDNCPANASDGYYVFDRTTFVSDPTSHPETECTLVPSRLLPPLSEYTFDTRVSQTHAKITLKEALPSCALMTGFVPVHDVAFVVSYESDVFDLPLRTPTRKPQIHWEPDAGPDSGPVEPPDSGPVEPPDSGPVSNPNRCSMHNSYVTLDGKDAFYFYDDDARFNALKKLVDAGVCRGHERLGANASHVTIDGKNAFYVYDENARIEFLLRLVAANVAKNGDRCGADSSHVTIDGRPSFYVYDETARANKLIELTNGNACETWHRLGANASHVTIAGKNAFYFYDETVRAQRLLRLIAAGAARNGHRCAVSGTAITKDGATLVSIYDEEQRLARFIELEQSGICDP